MPFDPTFQQPTYRAGQFPLPVAQYLRLRSQIPPLYALISVNSAILAYTHKTLVPPVLGIAVPAILIAVCLLRMLTWLQPLKPGELEPERVSRLLRRTTLLSVTIAAAFLSWALTLDSYGGPWEHGHVAIFLAVTVLGCVFCLNFLPQAAALVCFTVLGTFVTYAFIKGPEVLIAIAVNIALVAVVILKVLGDSYKSFLQLERSQRALHNERRQAQALGEENAQLAQTDALTGLPNRRFFFATLERILTRRETGMEFCVGLIDLDRFKAVNDTYGHAQGDRLLELIGQRMLANASPDVIVARLGGDEFGLIAMGNIDQAEAIARSLCYDICRPARIGEVVVSVGTSVGLAAYPQAATSANILFDRADFALYHAKNHKRGQCVRFTEELENLIRSDQAMDAALQAADLEQEISLVFQPIVTTSDLATVGVECLARWQSPTLGTVPPEQLISTAERLGRGREVTLALFDKALCAFAALPGATHVSFNLSGQDLCDSATIAGVLGRIDDTGCDPTRLLFEITETSLIGDIETACIALGRLREIGARIALDDFGTGYSSLSSLHNLPLDMVKIDRSFASRLDDASGRRLVTAIRNLARSLNLHCVIEGIETENQLLSARLAGFSLAQGYFMARPMPIEELLGRIQPSRTGVWSVA